MKLTERHKAIIEIVKNFEPITSDEIAEKLSLGKSTLRNDLAVLGMLEILEAKPNVGYYYNYNFSLGEQREEIRGKLVKDVMGIAITAKSTATYSEVLSKLFIYDVGTIFIVDENNHLAGVTSRKDMLKLSRNADGQNLPVVLAMTRVPTVIYIYEDELVTDALRKLILHEIDCLPVVRDEKDGKIIVGKISKTTLIKLLLEILEG